MARQGGPGHLPLYPDGLNAHSAYGSSPAVHHDPNGLFYGGLVGLFAPMSTLDTYLDYNQEVMNAGSSIQDAFGQVLDDYAYNQYDQVLWALNWDRSDDEFGYIPSGSGGGGASGDFAVGGIRLHHLATNKYWKSGQRWSHKFKKFFDNVDPPLSMNNKANLLEMSDEIHRGRHAEKYHQEVLDRLKTATIGKSAKEARDALIKELDAIKDWLRQNPDAINGNF